MNSPRSKVLVKRYREGSGLVRTATTRRGRGRAPALGKPLGGPVHGRFYGLRNFCCKIAQLCATRRESASLALALKNRLRNVLKSRAKRLA
jgi:hypothetical protein